MTETVVVRTSFPKLNLSSRGKVRDIYALGDALIIVATDRISCFDVVLGDGIPHKGQVLTSLSRFWFNLLAPITPNHLISTSASSFPGDVAEYHREMDGRAMLVHKCEPLKAECVVRGHLAGSGWEEYQRTGKIGEHRIPPGLKKGDPLPRAIFTPTTKAHEGHDEPVTLDQFARIVSSRWAEEVMDRSLKLYERARKYAQGRGIIVADTKFEFGLRNDQLILIDEVLTPDSSRFWEKDGASDRPVFDDAGEPRSYDKQYVRDYLLSIGFDKKPPAPALPPDVIERTSQKYLAAHRLLVGDLKDRMSAAGGTKKFPRWMKR